MIVCWRLDRLTRRVLHLASLIEWLRENDKSLVSTSEGFDVSTPMGRVFVSILGALAEGELEAIRERARASFRHLSAVGRWRGGFVPYGYRPERDEAGQGYRLVIDPEPARMIREIVRRIVDEGQAANAVVRWLNENRVPIPADVQRLRAGQEPRGSTWRVGNLLKMLRSEVLLGRSTVTEAVTTPEGRKERVVRVVRGSDGLPLQRADPILSEDEWRRLQLTLDGNSSGRTGKRSGATMLLRVAFCECGDPLYPINGRTKRYYTCSRRARTSFSCGNGSIPMLDLEKAVTDAFLGLVGDAPLTRRVFVPGEDHSTDLEAVQRAMSELLEDRAAGLYSSESAAATFRRMWGQLEERERALAGLNFVPDRWVEEETGETYAEHWARLETDAERNRELREAGVRVTLHREPVSTPSLLGGSSAEGSRVSIEFPERLKIAARSA
jgi:site-specific DNA recombinase